MNGNNIGPPRTSPFITPLEYGLFDIFLERLLTWQTTLNASIDYFRELSEIEKSREKGYRRAAAILAPRNLQQQSFGSFLGMLSSSSRSASPSPVKHQKHSDDANNAGSPNSPLKPPDRGNIWLVPLQAAALKAENEATGLAAFIEGETIARLQEIKLSFKENRNAIKDRLERVYKELNLHHDRLTSSISVYEQTVNSNQQQQTSDRTAAISFCDPWLSEVQLKGRIDGWIRHLSEHYRHLMELLQDIRSLDAQMTLRMGSVVREYFVLCSKTAAVQSEQLRDMAGLVEAVDVDGEWNAALIRGRLDYDWRLTVPPLDAFTHTVYAHMSTFNQRLQQYDIRRCGFLMKHSGGFARSWSIYFCILTDSHYFHGYRTAEMDHNEFRIPSTSLQLHKRSLAELNEGMFKCMREKPEMLAEPTVSIRLGSQGVSLRTESLSFSLTTVTSGGFFGKSEKKYSFKSWVDDDVMEWAESIRESIKAAESTEATSSKPVLHRQQNVDEADSNMIRHNYGVQSPQQHHNYDNNGQAEYRVNSYGDLDHAAKPYEPNTHKYYEYEEQPLHDQQRSSSSSSSASSTTMKFSSNIPEMDNPWK